MLSKASGQTVSVRRITPRMEMRVHTSLRVCHFVSTAKGNILRSDNVERVHKLKLRPLLKCKAGARGQRRDKSGEIRPVGKQILAYTIAVKRHHTNLCCKGTP
ncbi:hypothetical protein GOBAR_DD27119 [Gossypium barbadense]|nr:hypothetical protein GOBAR_DD27119 [Gossypium barbadense]